MTSKPGEIEAIKFAHGMTHDYVVKQILKSYELTEKEIKQPPKIDNDVLDLDYKYFQVLSNIPEYQEMKKTANVSIRTKIPFLTSQLKTNKHQSFMIYCQCACLNGKDKAQEFFDKAMKEEKEETEKFNKIKNPEDKNKYHNMIFFKEIRELIELLRQWNTETERFEKPNEIVALLKKIPCYSAKYYDFVSKFYKHLGRTRAEEDYKKFKSSLTKLLKQRTDKDKAYQDYWEKWQRSIVKAAIISELNKSQNKIETKQKLCQLFQTAKTDFDKLNFKLFKRIDHSCGADTFTISCDEIMLKCELTHSVFDLDFHESYENPLQYDKPPLISLELVVLLGCQTRIKNLLLETKIKGQ